MPSWAEILSEVQTAHDAARKKYLAQLSAVTGRNVIAYYSGWQQKSGPGTVFSILDSDMTGFMGAVNKLDRSKGLDLLLHTPGGEINATESIVNYLLYAFKGDVRAIVPHQAMSAGTIIALACREIIMGMHSSLGPIDPQVGGLSAHGLIEEFNAIQDALKDNPQKAQAWVPVLQQYRPTLIGTCLKAIKMTEGIVEGWLKANMFRGKKGALKTITKILHEFGSHQRSLNHGRHFNYDKVSATGVNVSQLESNPDLQEAALSAHHAFIVTFSGTRVVKIIQNHSGAAFIQSAAPDPK